MSIEDFNNLVISREGSKIVRFKDIGVAEVDAENTRSIAKRNGLPMVMCALIPSREQTTLILQTEPIS